MTIVLALLAVLLIVGPIALAIRVAYWEPSTVAAKRVPPWLGGQLEEHDEAA